MSDLEQFRDHARRMANAEHRDDCMRIHRIVKVDRWLSDHGLDRTLSCPDTTGHEPHTWEGVGLDFDCPGLCGGCMTDREAKLWRDLADEVDDYLTTDDDAGLWEDA